MKHFNLLKTTLLLCALIVGSLSSWADTYEQLTSIANIDESAEYVLGIDGTGFHYEGTSSWGKTALPSAHTPIYYTLKKANDGNSFTAEATIGSTKYYLQVPTSNTFSMATSTGTNTDLIIGTTQVSGTNYAVANKTTTARHLRINGTSGLRSYAGTTGTMAFFYKRVPDSPAYAITASSNNDSWGSVSLSGNVITATPATGYTYAAPAYSVNPANSATVLQEEDNFTVTPSADTEVTINFAPIPTHTATFSVNGDTSQQDYMEGTDIAFPSDPTAIDDKVFMGWVSSAIVGTTDDAPSFISSATMGKADVTFYAVFATQSGSGDPVWAETPLSAMTASDVFVVSNGSYAMTNDNGTGSAPSAEGITVSEGKITSTVADNLKWNVSGNATDGYTFYPNGDSEKWLYCNTTASSSSNNNIRVGTGGRKLWEFDASGYLKTKDTYTTRFLSIYDESDFRGYVNANSGAFVPKFYKYTSSVSYSEYCTTVVKASVARPEITLAANPFTFSTTATITCATNGADIKYSYDGENWSDYSAPLTITETKTIYAKAVLNSDESQIATVTATKNLVEPTVTIDATGITNTNLFAGTDAGSLSASVTYNDAAVEGAVVTWSGSDDEVAIINSTTGAVTLAGAGSVTFTATYAGNSDYSEKTATYEMTVVNDNPNAPGKQSNPYTVAQARAAIDAGEGVAGVYATGIVSEIVTAYNSQYGNISYNISVDGKTTSDQLQAYRGKSYNGDNFTSADDIQIGDVVVIYGNLKKHNSTYEFDQNNQLVSRVTKTAPTFALDVKEKTLDAYTHETVDVTLTTNTDGDVTCESSNPDVATVALKSAGVYTITAQSEGSATITIKSATSATYKPASASVAVTVEDGRADAGISFAETGIEKTWGEIFIGQALTNTNSVEVTYSSTDESVAIVSSTGVVTVLKAGTTTIKATFAGNATYKASVASYDLTINKAEAGLSFDETEFEVDLNDDSFVAPTLNNPNSLTVTYDSNNDELALVDNTGELLLVTSAEGTVKITASFAGNDNYKSGSASYTITVTDPNKKGTKKNPYTVAEVKNGTATGSGIYVVGYIVGNYNATSPVNPATGDTNLALADNADETAGSNTIPVELQDKGSLREDWGPKSNNLIGYKVLIKGNKDTYFSTNGIKKVTEISAVSVPVSITAAGFATYAGDFGLDFSGLDVKVYKARVNGTTITFDKVTEVPAGEGVLLQGEGTFEVPVKSVDAWAADDNAFVRGTGAAVATGDGPYNYILNKVNGVVGFYKANGQTVAKNRAYLQSTTAAARISLNFDEETTGISEVVKSDVNNKVFDLQGRHIAQPTKGLYIMNGRKVLVK